MAESFSREKNKASTAERRWVENPVLPSSCVTPAGTSIEVQNEWEENTHTHQGSYYVESNSVLCTCRRIIPDTTSALSSTAEDLTNRHMECGIARETSMPPPKCGCFGSAA